MLGLHEHRIRLHPEVAVSVMVNVAQSLEEAEMQERLGHAIIPSESGDADDDRALAEAAFEEPPAAPEDEAVADTEFTEGEGEAKTEG